MENLAGGNIIQDACFVVTMIGDHPAISFVACSVDMYCEGLHQGY